MEPALISPASATLAGIPAKILFILIPLAGIGIFAWIMRRRIEPLLKAAPDNRLQRIPERIRAVLKIWLGQWRHPRYMLAGVLHIILFFGFLILGARSTQLVVLGFVDGFTLPGFGGTFGVVYNVLKDYAGTAVFISVAILAIRRGAFKPARYAVPERYGKDHTPEALFVLGLIATLLITESLFEASLMAAQALKGQHAELAPPLTTGVAVSAPAGWRLDRRPPGTSPGGLHDPRPDLFLLSVLPADGQALPRHHLAVQRVFHAARPGQREARAPRCRREQAGRAQILRRQDLRGLHLEAHAGLLQLRRLRPLFGPLPGQPRQTAPLPAVHLDQGARLRLRALPAARDGGRREPRRSSAAFTAKTKSGPAPHAAPAKRSARWGSNTSTRWWICAGAWWTMAWCPSRCRSR